MTPGKLIKASLSSTVKSKESLPLCYGEVRMTTLKTSMGTLWTISKFAWTSCTGHQVKPSPSPFFLSNKGTALHTVLFIALQPPLWKKRQDFWLNYLFNLLREKNFVSSPLTSQKFISQFLLLGEWDEIRNLTGMHFISINYFCFKINYWDTYDILYCDDEYFILNILNSLLQMEKLTLMLVICINILIYICIWDYKNLWIWI